MEKELLKVLETSLKSWIEEMVDEKMNAREQIAAQVEARNNKAP